MVAAVAGLQRQVGHGPWAGRRWRGQPALYAGEAELLHLGEHALQSIWSQAGGDNRGIFPAPPPPASRPGPSRRLVLPPGPRVSRRSFEAARPSWRECVHQLQILDHHPFLCANLFSAGVRGFPPCPQPLRPARDASLAARMLPVPPPLPTPPLLWPQNACDWINP